MEPAKPPVVVWHHLRARYDKDPVCVCGPVSVAIRHLSAEEPYKYRLEHNGVVRPFVYDSFRNAKIAAAALARRKVPERWIGPITDLYDAKKRGENTLAWAIRHGLAGGDEGFATWWDQCKDGESMFYLAVNALRNREYTSGSTTINDSESVSELYDVTRDKYVDIAGQVGWPQFWSRMARELRSYRPTLAELDACNMVH